MITCITKRDGRTRPFDIEKIANAIYKAAQAIGGHDYQTSLALANRVAEELEAQLGEAAPSVEQVQDTVEKVLIENGHARTAKEFILYRAERTRIREMNTRLMKTMEDLTFQDAKDNDVKREKREHRRGFPDGDHAQIWVGECETVLRDVHSQSRPLRSPPQRRHPHPRSGLLNPDHHLLPDRHPEAVSRRFRHRPRLPAEPNDIASYAALACIAIQSNQNDQHGGQSIPNFDYGMAEGVKKPIAASIVRTCPGLSNS